MQVEDSERFMRLEHLCGRTFFDAREVYQVRACDGVGGAGGNDGCCC